MTVKTILSAKGGDVISIEPTATLETAVKTLAKHRIGALLVLGPDPPSLDRLFAVGEDRQQVGAALDGRAFAVVGARRHALAPLARRESRRQPFRTGQPPGVRQSIRAPAFDGWAE